MCRFQPPLPSPSTLQEQLFIPTPITLTPQPWGPSRTRAAWCRATDRDEVPRALEGGLAAIDRDEKDHGVSVEENVGRRRDHDDALGPMVDLGALASVTCCERCHYLASQEHGGEGEFQAPARHMPAGGDQTVQVMTYTV